MLRIVPAGWHYKDWEGIVYPKPLPKGFHGAEYLSKLFDTVEINNTFYRPPLPQMAKAWAKHVSANRKFRFTAKLGGRIARQLVATAAMGVALWWAMPLMADRYAGSVFDRVWSLSALVGLGMVVFFAVAWISGALDEDLVKLLKRRRPKRNKSDDEILEV